MGSAAPAEPVLDAALKRAAEREMRRILPDSKDNSERAAKRAKGEAGEELGRFDYGADKELASGMAGFLVFSDFRRERSSTREAFSLLLPHLASITEKGATASNTIEPSTATAAADNSLQVEQQPEDEIKPPALMSIVKLSARGLAAIRLLPQSGPEDTAQRAQNAALAVYTDVTEATLPAPKFALRIMPFISTCALEVGALQECAARLADIAAPDLLNASQPTFGIAFHNRKPSDYLPDTQDTQGPAIICNNTSANNGASVTDRGAVISAVAAGFSSALKAKFNIDVAVDLKSPAVVVCVESLLVSGKIYAALAVVPHRICTLKPRLGIKALQTLQGAAKKPTKGPKQPSKKP